MKFKDLIKLVLCFYFPLAVFLFSLVLGFFDAYDLYPWIDVPMHFLGGFSIAYASILVLREVRGEVVVKDRFFEVMIILGFVCIAAVLWELGEFLVDYFFNWGWQLGLEDTLFDLFMGMVGGLVATLFWKIS